MESWIGLICNYASDAHWILFILLMLAGLNIPISEDLILLTGGALAATCIPDEKWHLYTWLYFGCWISGWEAYWIGRRLGPKLYDVKWFSRILTPQRIDRLHYYYEKFGIMTFIVGRFIPGGVRNALFMSSGLGKMPFIKFALRDMIACLISTLVIYNIGFQFAEHYETIFRTFEAYNWVVIGIILCIILAIIGWNRYMKSNKALL